MMKIGFSVLLAARIIFIIASVMFPLTVIAEEEPSADLMSMSLEELAHIKISSVSKRSEPLANAAAAIYVITHEDIQRSGATSIPEVLRLAPNLQVARSADANVYAITARGLNGPSNKLLVLIDGRSVYTPLHSGVFWDAQDTLINDIERIEVISGPGGTLWGSNAVNGVINIITKSSADTQGTFASIGTGNDESGAAARYGDHIGENGTFRLYAKGFNRDNTVTATGINQDDEWGNRQSGFRSDWSDDDDVVTLQGDIYDGDIDPNTTFSGNNLLTRWNHSFGENNIVQVQAYYDHVERTLSGVYSENRGTYDLDIQHQFNIGDVNEIVWGGGYRATQDDVNNRNPVLVFLPQDQKLNLSNIYLQDTIALSDHLKLTLGAKLERNDYTGTESQPNARLAWQFDENTLLWSAISKAVRTPSRFDREFYVVPILRGGPDFQSEKLTAYEIGYRAQPTKKTSISISTFYNDYEQLRSIDFNPGGYFVFGNSIEGYTYGVEIWGTYQVTDTWSLKAGYNSLEEHLHFTNNSGTSKQATDFSGQDPNHQFSLQSSLNLPNAVELDTTIRHVGEITASDVPSYTAVDVRVGWHVNKKLTLSVAGFNLFDPHHAEFGADTPARAEVNRSVYLEAQLNF